MMLKNDEEDPLHRLCESEEELHRAKEDRNTIHNIKTRKAELDWSSLGHELPAKTRY